MPKNRQKTKSSRSKGSRPKAARAYPELRLSPDEIDTFIGNPEKMPGVSWLAALFGRVPLRDPRKDISA